MNAPNGEEHEENTLYGPTGSQRFQGPLSSESTYRVYKNRHHPHFVYETSVLFLISRQTGKRLLLFEFGILESIPNAANGFNLAAMFAHFSTKCSNVNVDGPFHNKRVLT